MPADTFFDDLMAAPDARAGAAQDPEECFARLAGGRRRRPRARAQLLRAIITI